MSDTDEPRPGPTDEPTQDPPSATPDPAEEADTEGHSMAIYEYGRTVDRERHRDAERAASDARRMGDRKPAKGLIDRLRGR